MNDPYLTLGVSPNASNDDIRNAYRMLARKYAENSSKMDEINAAYDEIVVERGGLSSSKSSSSSAHNNYSGYTNYTSDRSSNSYSGYNGGYSNYSDLHDIRDKIKNGRIEDALVLLDGIPESRRSAEWFYLKGVAQQRRGWLDYAADNFVRACAMDPSNREYAAAKARLDNSKNGGYRKTRERDNHGCTCCACDGCDICSSLLCADCCCECFGGDLIPGC